MPIQISQRYLIICEGKADVAFLEHLIIERDLPQFQVIPANGNSRYQEILLALTAAPGFADLAGILVVADNDLNPAAAFQNVRTQIRDAGGYAVPDAMRIPVLSPQFPSIAVLMVPWDDEIGCLETILLDAVRAVKPELAACAEDYAVCTHVNDWNEIEKAKMKLQSLTSVICRSDPTTPVSFVWSRTEEIISLSQPCFNRIADFLQNFPHILD
jgi:hypothetical protein